MNKKYLRRYTYILMLCDYLLLLCIFTHSLLMWKMKCWTANSFRHRIFVSYHRALLLLLHFGLVCVTLTLVRSRSFESVLLLLWPVVARTVLHFVLFCFILLSLLVSISLYLTLPFWWIFKTLTFIATVGSVCCYFPKRERCAHIGFIYMHILYMIIDASYIRRYFFF